MRHFLAPTCREHYPCIAATPTSHHTLLAASESDLD